MAPRADIRARPRATRSDCGGFTFLGLMFLIVLMSILAGAAATTWEFRSQRDKELQLLFVGHAYRAAIIRYAQAHARDREPFPTDLKLLVEDGDQLVPVRYLRRLYFDPITGGADWGLVRTPTGGITAVYSLSEKRPVRVVAPVGPSDGIDFTHAKTYQDWVFAAPVAQGAQDAGTDAVPGWDYARLGSPPLSWDGKAPPTPASPD